MAIKKSAKLKNISEIEECPFCGNDEWFRKQKVSGEIWHKARFDGQEAENGSLYESTNIVNKSNFAFCSECLRKIGLLED